MKKEEDISVTLVLLLLTQTALNAGVYSHGDTMMQLGPVEAMQGHSISLWCKVKYDSERIMPVNWQSPPNFKTRTSDCHSYKTGKYIMSCSDTEDSFEFYNMTIMDVEWADMGEYRCVHAEIVGNVDLLVLVPVTEVTLKKVVTSTAEDPLLVHKYITCSTNCAYPAPIISWFENDQRFNGTAVVTELGCSEDMEGQKRTTSTVTVKDIYKDEERKEYVISCNAVNVNGQPKISKAITITYEEVPPSPLQPIKAEYHYLEVTLSLVAFVIFMAVTILMLWLRKLNKEVDRFASHRSACVDHEKNAGTENAGLLNSGDPLLSTNKPESNDCFHIDERGFASYRSDCKKNAGTENSGLLTSGDPLPSTNELESNDSFCLEHTVPAGVEPNKRLPNPGRMQSNTDSLTAESLHTVPYGVEPNKRLPNPGRMQSNTDSLTADSLVDGSSHRFDIVDDEKNVETEHTGVLNSGDINETESNNLCDQGHPVPAWDGPSPQLHNPGRRYSHPDLPSKVRKRTFEASMD